MALDALYFREKALHCRCLAVMAWSHNIAGELLRLADSFEAEAMLRERDDCVRFRRPVGNQNTPIERPRAERAS